MTTSFEDDAASVITAIIRTTINEDNQAQQSIFNKQADFVGASTASIFNIAIIIGDIIATKQFASVIGISLLPRVKDIT